MCYIPVPCLLQVSEKLWFCDERPRSEEDNALGSVRPSVFPFVCALTADPFDLRPSSFAWGSTLTLVRLAM